MTATTWSDEWRITAREPVFRWAWLLVILLTGACLLNGFHFKAERDAQARAEIARSLEKRAADKVILQREARGEITVDPWGPGNPTKPDWNAVRSSGALAHLSFGQEDMAPLSANISLWMTRSDNLFRKYQLQSPLALAAGRFDAGFLVVILLPLFCIALTYDLIANERETSRLRLLASQGDSFRRRLLLRFALRLSPVCSAILIVAAIAAIAGAPLESLALWSSAALAYFLFWAGVCTWIATAEGRQETLALAGAACWLLLVIVTPGLAGAAGRILIPSPSQLELINGVRAAEVAANRELVELLKIYVNDHPELGGVADANDWAAKLYVAQRVVERHIAPLRRDHEAQRTRQRALASQSRFLSPAMAAQHVLTAAAGTDAIRQDAYVEQTEAFLQHWQVQLSPLIFRQQRITAADVDSLPRFAFREPPPLRRDVLYSLAYLGALAAVVTLLALRRFHRLETAR